MQALTKTIKQFADRQSDVKKLAPKLPNKLVITHLQTLFTALGACAALLTELQPLLQPTGTRKPTRQTLEDDFGVELLSTLNHLIEDAEKIAIGRDWEVVRAVGWRLLGTSAKWLGKALPLRPEDIKDAYEAAELVGDVVSLRAVLKTKKKQADASAILLNWSKVSTLVAMHWAMEAERIADLLNHKPDRTEQQLAAVVQQRMVALVAKW